MTTCSSIIHSCFSDPTNSHSSEADPNNACSNANAWDVCFFAINCFADSGISQCVSTAQTTRQSARRCSVPIALAIARGCPFKNPRHSPGATVSCCHRPCFGPGYSMVKAPSFTQKVSKSPTSLADCANKLARIKNESRSCGARATSPKVGCTSAVTNPP